MPHFFMDLMFSIPTSPRSRHTAAAEGARHFLLVLEHAVGEVEMYGEPVGGIADVEVLQPGRVADLRASTDEIEATLTAFAERHGGEYDGPRAGTPEP